MPFLLLTRRAWGLAAVPFLLQLGQASSTGCEHVKNFTQLVDHVGGTTSPQAPTFLQQYQLDTSLYRPGGPILFHQGDEAATMFCVEDLILPTWAAELGAAVATLEHRFFGNSVPSNATDPIQRFRTLTPDNVMLDSVNFIDWVKSTVPEAKSSKVIVQGGSYGAILSSWLRLNYPKTFYGAISSAAPLRGFGFPVNNTVNYNWQSWISSVFSLQSAEASAKIKAAFLELEQQIATPKGRSRLPAAFNLCSTVDSAEQGANLMSILTYTYGYATQFNFANPQAPAANQSARIGYSIPSPLEKLINVTLAIPANETLRILNASLALYMDQFGDCVEYTTGAPPFPGIEQSVFEYITCSYVTFSDVSVPLGAMFPPVPLNAAASLLAYCKERFNTTIMSGPEIERRYHFTQADVQDSTRLLLVAGEFDPTSSLMPLAWDFAPNPNASRVLYVSEMAHCEDTTKPRAGDRETVTRVSSLRKFDNSPYLLMVEQARHYELQTIKEWLGQ